MSHAVCNDPTQNATRTLTVLLVDDQAMVHEAVRRMLADQPDIRLVTVQEPARAVQTALAEAPTLILQDLVMPDVDGLTLLRFYRAHPKLKEVPVIVLSTREEATTKAEAFKLGASDYLVKLPDPIELIARIRHHSAGYLNLLERNAAYEALALQLSRAAEYVTSLLPAPLNGGELTADWRFVPSTQLGGDSFGYHKMDTEHWAIYLLDVCDHGVGPALLSVSALNVLRSQSLPNRDFRDPSDVLSGLNDTFQMENQNDLYFTIWYGVYHVPTRRLTYASAGHPPALLHSGGEVQRLMTKNIMIGGMPGVPYMADSVEVPAGARLFVYSDGVYEVTKAVDNCMWTFDEFEDYMRGLPSDGGEMDALLAHLQTISGEKALPDDFSILRVALP